MRHAGHKPPPKETLMIDTTKFCELRKAAILIGSRKNRETAFDIIDSGMLNAGETVYTDKACPEEDWNRIFIETIQENLSYHKYNRHVVGFFAKNGINF
jgi:hypothetical protein